MKSTQCRVRRYDQEGRADPRQGCGRDLPTHPFLLIALVLVLVLAGNAPVSAVDLGEHVLGRASGAGPAIESTQVFVRDDVVVSEVTLTAAGGGDLLVWTFTGPRGGEETVSQALSPGQGMARATLDLSLLPPEEAVGSWTLDLSLNGVPGLSQDFSVEPLTGLVWWGPFVGGGVLVLSVVILGVLVCAGVVILQRFFRKKKEI